MQEATGKTGAQPSDKKIASALTTVDDQLNDVIFACLDPVQEYRPLATEVQESLAHFVDSYGRNIKNALEEQPLSSCTDSAFERRARAANAKKSRRWSHRREHRCLAILLVAVSFVTAGLVDSSRVIVSFGPIHWIGGPQRLGNRGIAMASRACRMHRARCVAWQAFVACMDRWRRGYWHAARTCLCVEHIICHTGGFLVAARRVGRIGNAVVECAFLWHHHRQNAYDTGGKSAHQHGGIARQAKG